MANRTVKGTGICQWAKVHEATRDMEGYNGAYKDCDGAYTIDVFVEVGELNELKAAGSMLNGSITDDGVKIKLKRKHKGPFAAASGAPTVVKADGTPWDLDVDGTIGNGSKVEYTVTCYDIKSFGTVGTRLEKIKVLDHVVFVRDEDVMDSDEVVV